jgi:hypothetical protein
VNIDQAFLIIAQKGIGKICSTEIDYGFTLEETKPKYSKGDDAGCC